MALPMLIDISVIPSWLIILLVAWTIPWKGIALWRSARNNQKIWFIVFLLVNTVGILEILYILFWQHKRR
jgi:methionyl-tRNA synthetase